MLRTLKSGWEPEVTPRGKETSDVVLKNTSWESESKLTVGKKEGDLQDGLMESKEGYLSWDQTLVYDCVWGWMW